MSGRGQEGDGRVSMDAGNDYRIKAANMHARAQQERNSRVRTELESLALSYLRLADQADRNERSRFVQETQPQQTVSQQQQQPQPGKSGGPGPQ
jgi:hypothetical protein